MEALACVGNIAKAMGPSMEPYVRSLLDAMFSVGLSSTLVEALGNITARSSARHLLMCFCVLFSRSGVLISYLVLQHSIFASNPSSTLA